MLRTSAFFLFLSITTFAIDDVLKERENKGGLKDSHPQGLIDEKNSDPNLFPKKKPEAKAKEESISPRMQRRFERIRARRLKQLEEKKANQPTAIPRK